MPLNEKAELKLLDHLGLIEIEPGPRLVNVFRFIAGAALICEAVGTGARGEAASNLWQGRRNRSQ